MALKKEKKQLDATKILLTIGYVAVTVIALVFTLIICAKPFKITDYDDLKQVEVENYKSQKPTEYYVFIYSNSKVENAWYKDIVVEYANVARTTSNILPIYGYDLEAKGNGVILDELTLRGVPALIKVKENGVTNKFTDYADINNELSGLLEK